MGESFSKSYRVLCVQSLITTGRGWGRSRAILYLYLIQVSTSDRGVVLRICYVRNSGRSGAFSEFLEPAIGESVLYLLKVCTSDKRGGRRFRSLCHPHVST